MNQAQSFGFDNKTALERFDQIKDEDCVSSTIENTTTEFRIRADCATDGLYVLTRNGNHTQYQMSYTNGATDTAPVEWLSLDNKRAPGEFVDFSPACVSATAAHSPSASRAI